MVENEFELHDAVVIGAGFAGIYMLYRLRQSGFTAVCLEAGADVGGTWYWNRYPGARCDAESIEYSYSFDAALEQEWRWSERFATQPEIQRYARHVVDRFGLGDGIRLGTRVLSAHYDESSGRWHVATDRGDRISARFLLGAVGCLSVPKEADVQGKEAFLGAAYRSASWPEGGVDFTGKRVGVIGTGSTGTQIIPLVAEQAAALAVFQRTPNFSVPAHNAPISDERDARVKADYAAIRAAAREVGSAQMPMGDKSALAVTQEERQAKYEACWQLGGPILQLSFYDLMIDERANQTAADFVRAKIRETVADPDLATKLSPTSFPLGTKRLCVDTGYYATFNRPNVRLVDLRETPIETITPGGIRFDSGEEIELDAIVYATGFDAMTGALFAIDIRGRGGLALREKWRDGPHTYLGLATADFPNMFVITGPGSPSVLSNVMVSIEQHVEWIDRLLVHMRERAIETIEPTAEAEAEWTAHVSAIAGMTLFPKAASWYMGANVPGKPRVFLPYVGGVGNYRRHCDAIAAKGYPGFTARLLETV